MYNLKDCIPGVASYAEFLEMLDAKNNKKPDLTDKDKKNDFQIYAKNFISQERSAKSLNLDGFKIVDVKNRKKEIVVKRLDEESIRERKIPAGEKDIMDKCYDMLRAHKSLFSNSKEFYDILNGLKDTGKNLDNIKDNGKRTEQYIKDIKGVMENIDRYMLHKAKDGYKKDSDIMGKMVACERIYKLLGARCEDLEKN